MNLELLKLSEDVRNLYFKTGIKEIEDNYISLVANAEQNFTNEDILSWLNTNQIVPDGISDPKVYKALKILSTINENDLINKWNNWIVENFKLSNQFAKPKKDFDYPGDYLGYFIIFSKLIGNEDAGLLLSPFENILKFFASPQVQEQVGDIISQPNDFTVFHDMMKLQKYFIRIKGKLTETSHLRVPTAEYGHEKKQEKKQNLYDDLYDWFSDDIAKAASNVGYQDFAKEMESGALLGNIAIMGDYLDRTGLSDSVLVREPNIIYIELLEEIIKFIMKPANLNRFLKPENHIEAYREIKEFIMQMVGYATREHVVQVRNDRRKQIQRPSKTKGQYLEQRLIEGPEIEIDDEAWMSGKVISLIAKVLEELHYRLNL